MPPLFSPFESAILWAVVFMDGATLAAVMVKSLVTPGMLKPGAKPFVFVFSACCAGLAALALCVIYKIVVKP